VPIFDSSSYIFSAYAVPVFVTALLMLAFGLRVMTRRLSRVSVAFFGMTTACGVWLLAFTGMYSTREESVALFWAHVAYFGVPFIAPAVYQFSVEMLRIHKKRRLETYQGWLLGGSFAVIGIKTSFLITHVQRYAWGFYPRYGVMMSVPFLIFFGGYLVAAVFEFSRAYGHARGTEQRRIRLLLIGFAIAYTGCVDYLAKYGVPVYPFGYLSLFAFIVIAAVVFRRYDLIPLTPSLAASGIIGTMADALFVCDR
jgi:hypothetical protein